MRRQPKLFRTHYAPPLAVIGISLLAIFALFALLVTQQNRLSDEREHSQLKAAIASRVDFLASNMRDYSRWSDAVEHLASPGPVDSEWANENIGPYMFRNKGYDHSFVVGHDGKTLYASYKDQQSRESVEAALGGLERIMKRLRAAPDGVEERFAEIDIVDGKPAIIAASVILPSLGENYRSPYERRYLLFVEPMDKDFVASVASSLNLEGLVIDLNKMGGDEAAMPLLTGEGKPIAHLQWKPLRPGDSMYGVYLPALAFIALLSAYLCFYIIRSSSQVLRELAASEGQARHLANHDTLTGLPNRRALRARGMRLSDDQVMAMLFLDLDGFKEVNDLFGHQAGDVLLQEATDRLQDIVGKRGLLARVGGDEFAVLVTCQNAHSVAVELAAAVVKTMVAPFESNEIRMVVSASVGIALGDRGQSIDDLARLADVAMYAAKSDGKNCWRVYMPSMDEGREVRKILESELRDDVEAGRVEVLFQPIIDARAGGVGTVEALARWTSSSQGPVGPAIFVPIAEESGLIVRMGELVLRKACMAARDWNVSLAVNISPAQFWHGSLVEEIMQILSECDFPPERLELEITEGYLLSRPDLAAEVIRRIRAHGIRVALDDFGTGFASIGYLQRFALDRLKLDRSFVERVDKDMEAARVTRAVIDLSHALGLPITAEGIETGGQAIFMTLAGCERLQGWYYGKAMSAEAVARMIARGAPDELDPARFAVAN